MSTIARYINLLDHYTVQYSHLGVKKSPKYQTLESSRIAVRFWFRATAEPSHCKNLDLRNYETMTILGNRCIITTHTLCNIQICNFLRS